MRTSFIAVTLLPYCALVLGACSGGDSHRLTSSDAGADGSSGASGNGSGSGGKGVGGQGGKGGSAGNGGGGASGSAGSGVGGKDAGIGGAGGAVPEAGLAAGVFFSVARGATGLPGSGVTALATPETAIFASNGSGASHVAGTNALGVTAAQLGLLDADDIEGIAVLKPAPAHPLYHFSMAAGASSAGYRHTDVERSFLETEVPGDVFVSDGIGQNYDGEGGRRPGFNALTIDEARLGLSTKAALTDGSAASADDLDALELGVTEVPSRLYFTVAKGASGKSGSSLAGTAASERGCTIFESGLLGTHKKAFSCADLGLEPGDEIDALAMYGASAPQQILFSVRIGAVGKVGTAVATEATNLEAGGDVFRSDGAGANDLLVDEAGLGLNPGDELDALAVTDQELAPHFEFDDTGCRRLTPDPRNDTTGTLAYDTNWRSWVSTGIFVIGRVARFSRSPVELIAYDVATCAQVGASVMLDLVADGGEAFGRPLAVVPRAGWSKASPFVNTEIWGFNQLSGTALVRFAASGGPPVQVALVTPSLPSPVNMVYRKTTDDFAVLFQVNTGKVITFLERPAPATRTVTFATSFPVPYPCEEYQGLMGYDLAAGGVEVGHNNTGGGRVCSLDDELHFREPPRHWTDGATDGGVLPTRTMYDGFVVPGEGLFGLSTQNSYHLVPLGSVP